MSDLSHLNVPFDKVLEIVSEQLIIAKDDICIALEKLKIGDKESVHWRRQHDSYNRAIDDVIQVIKNH